MKTPKIRVRLFDGYWRVRVGQLGIMYFNPNIVQLELFSAKLCEAMNRGAWIECQNFRVYRTSEPKYAVFAPETRLHCKPGGFWDIGDKPWTYRVLRTCGTGLYC